METALSFNVPTKTAELFVANEGYPKANQQYDPNKLSFVGTQMVVDGLIYLNSSPNFMKTSIMVVLENTPENRMKALFDYISLS